MLNFMIVVEDAGELKSVSAVELYAWAKARDGAESLLPEVLQVALNAILDQRAIDAGEYDPADNDTPFDVVIGAEVNG